MLLRLSVAEEDTAEAEKLWPAAVPRRRISAAKREDSERSPRRRRRRGPRKEKEKSQEA